MGELPSCAHLCAAVEKHRGFKGGHAGTIAAAGTWALILNYNSTVENKDSQTQGHSDQSRCSHLHVLGRRQQRCCGECGCCAGAQMSFRSFWMVHRVSALFLSWDTSSSVRLMLTTLLTPLLFSTHGRDRKTSSSMPYMSCPNTQMDIWIYTDVYYGRGREGARESGGEREGEERRRGGSPTLTMVETGWTRLMFLTILSVRSATLRPMAQLV